MSKPTKEITLQGLACEIISAMSSLNMEPNPIPKDEIGETAQEDFAYLSECDSWAKHCQEHNKANFDSVKIIRAKVEKIKQGLWSLYANENVLKDVRHKIEKLIDQVDEIL